MKARHVMLALAAAGLMSTQAHAGADAGEARVSAARAAQAVQNGARESKAADATHEALAGQVFDKAGEQRVAVLSSEEMKETRGAYIPIHLLHVRFPGYYGTDGRWHLWGSPFNRGVPVDWGRGPYLLSM